MESKPLSYDSMKILMQYLPSMTRMKLSSRCPSLRKVEKVVPLRLESVSLGEYVTVDKTQFRLYLIQKCPERVPVPTCFHYGFDVFYDTLDIHGCFDLEDRNSWTPGDLMMKTICGQSENVIASLQEGIEALKAALPEDGGLLQDRINIEVKELSLQAFINRRDNILSPYETVYRLEVIQEGKETQRFYSNVDMKFSLKLKQLSTFLFGGRKDPISVKKLIIESWNKTIRLPPGPLFKVQKLHLPCLLNNDIRAGSALHDSSFPLEELSLEDIELEDMNNEVVRNAKTLSVKFHDETLEQVRLVDFVIGNENSQLTIRNLLPEDLSYEDLIEMMTQARARGRDIHVLMIFNELPNFVDRLFEIKLEFQGDMMDNYVFVTMGPPQRLQTYLTISFNRPHYEFPFSARLRTLQIENPSFR